jgi:glycosyltransferase involved in cell wall biosynthesis
MPDLWPFVSVIVPARNEAAGIARCLDALVAQDYPVDRLEILFVDGMSSDATRAIVADYGRRHAQIRVLDNPRGIVPSALNIGLREARGEIIVRVDGHCVVAPDYISACVDRLRATRADNVGGRMHAAGDDYMAKAIAIATSSPFGIGNSRFHYSQAEEYVDTVYLGAYRREVFERIGGFDEELVRNQDDELNYRLRAAGGRILLSPAIKSRYYGRGRLSDLFRQYYQYGFWKVRVAQKHRRALLPRHYAPAAFVLTKALLWLAAPFDRRMRRLAGAATTIYLVAAAVFAFRASAGHGHRYAPAILGAFFCLHFGYGVGFLAGLLKLLRAGGKPWTA